MSFFTYSAFEFCSYNWSMTCKLLFVCVFTRWWSICIYLLTLQQDVCIVKPWTIHYLRGETNLKGFKVLLNIVAMRSWFTFLVQITNCLLNYMCHLLMWLGSAAFNTCFYMLLKVASFLVCSFRFFAVHDAFSCSFNINFKIVISDMQQPSSTIQVSLLSLHFTL